MLKFEINLVDISSSPNTILLWAAWLDYLIGDPWGWLHPVQVMGWVIQNYTDLTVKACPPGWQRRLAGVGLGLGLIIGSGLISWLIIWLGKTVHPIL
ncbi:MAG: hypothetical protein RLZZ499_2710, partial [Cyanobacteriota bacterium]